jgi:hypothetical protein
LPLTLYGIQVGALETKEFRQQPIPFVVLPNGIVVEMRVEKRAVRRPITSNVMISRVLCFERPRREPAVGFAY